LKSTGARREGENPVADRGNGQEVESGTGDVGALLRKGADALQLSLGTEEIALLVRYYQELLHWSRRINLIAKKQRPEQIVENHFLDSLLLLPSLQEPGCSLLDVGTGAGFPGLVCKAASPRLDLALVEPRLKRVSFLRHILRSLRLEGVDIHAERVEDLDFTDLHCTHVTGRAVAEIGDFATMIEAILDRDTRVVCMKGPKWRQELKKAAPVLADLSLRLENAEERRLPFSGAERAILTFRRFKP